MVSGKWTKLAIPALQRSSHSLSIIGPKAYIWGGELEPRRPVDTDVHVVDLKDGCYERVEASGAPSPRVAHAGAAVDGKVYIFGGVSIPSPPTPSTPHLVLPSSSSEPVLCSIY